MNIVSPPFPYKQEDWDKLFPIWEKNYVGSLAEWRAKEEGRREWVGSMPVMCIREKDPETGVEKFLGDISVHRRCVDQVSPGPFSMEHF